MTVGDAANRIEEVASLLSEEWIGADYIDLPIDDDAYRMFLGSKCSARLYAACYDLEKDNHKLMRIARLAATKRIARVRSMMGMPIDGSPPGNDPGDSI